MHGLHDRLERNDALELRSDEFDLCRRVARDVAPGDKEKGDMAGARAILEGILSIEEVPLYREQAQIALDDMDEPED